MNATEDRLRSVGGKTFPLVLLALAGIYIFFNVTFYFCLGHWLFSDGFRVVVVWVSPMLGSIAALAVGAKTIQKNWPALLAFIAFMILMGWGNNWLIDELAGSV